MVPNEYCVVLQQVLLAIKLPSGQRIEHQFAASNQLYSVLRYVETATEQDLTDCLFVSADRSAILSDLKLTIAAAGILNRSILYLQLPPDD